VTSLVRFQACERVDRVRLRALIVACGVAFSIAPAGLAVTPQACAATPDHAALVVDSGAHSATYCVAIPSGGVTGLGLIERASDQYGLDYLLGDNGQAVCRLGGVGSSDPNDCFSTYPYFWGYWHGSTSGAWAWASTGGGSYTVHPGDIDGWSWSTGQDGSSHEAPPRATYAKVCGTIPSPQPTPTHQPSPHKDHKRHSQTVGPTRPRTGGPKQRHRSAGPSGAPMASPHPSASHKAAPAVTPSEHRRGRSKHPAALRPSGSPSAKAAPRSNVTKKKKVHDHSPIPLPTGSAVAFASSSRGAAGGPPAAGIAALAAAVVLGGAGAVLARRRTTR
jgi:hypothetical protein